MRTVSLYNNRKKLALLFLFCLALNLFLGISVYAGNVETKEKDKPWYETQGISLSEVPYTDVKGLKPYADDSAKEALSSRTKWEEARKGSVDLSGTLANYTNSTGLNYAPASITQVFGSNIRDFRPKSDLASSVLSFIFYIIELAFAMLAQLLILFLFLQFLCDIFAINFEWAHGLLGVGIGGTKTMDNKDRKGGISLCSRVARDLVKGESNPSSGGYGSSSNNEKAGGNVVGRYLKGQTPAIITVFVSVTLVSTGIWLTISQFIITQVSYIMNALFNAA